jgi:hypothetical protein
VTDILDDFDAIDNEIAADRGARLRAANTLAADRDPEQYGRANAIADRRGLPVDVVADNLPDFEQREQAEELDALAQRAPEVGSFLSDPRRLALAKDDTGTLERLAGALRVGPTSAQGERTWGEFFSDLGTSTRMMGREGIASLGTAPRDAVNWINSAVNADAARLAGLFGKKPSAMIPMQESLFGFEPALRRATDEVNAQDRERLSFTQAAQERDRPETLTGTLGWYAKNPGLIATDAAGAAGYMAAGGIVPGKTQLTIAAQALGQASGAVEQVRQRLIEKGLTEQEARAAAANVFGPALAIGIAAPNVVPGGASLERLIGGEVAKTAASRFGRVAAPLVGEPIAEGGEESAIQLAQNLTADDPASRGVGGAFGMGAVLGFGMALPPAVAGARSNPAQDREMLAEVGRLARSITGHDRLRAITKAAAQSALAKRSPADAEAFARQVGGEGSVYLKADEALVLFQDDRGALVDLVGGQDALDEQLATGDIEIPMARWVARVAQRPNADELVRHARTDADGLSPVEIERLDAQAADYAAHGTDDAAADRAAPESPDARERVTQDVAGQLVATGRYSPERAEAQGKLWGAAFTRLGQMAGVDGFELYQRHMAGIGTGGADPRTARRWSGGGRLDAALTAARSPDTLPQGRGPRLTTWLVNAGGVQDQGGELRGFDAGKQRPGLVSRTGLTQDRARELAAESGFLPADSDLADFLDLIDRDLRNGDVFSEALADQSVQELAAEVAEIRAAMDADPAIRDMPRDQFEALTNQQVAEMLFGRSFDQAPLTDISKALLERWAADPDALLAQYAALEDADGGRALDTDLFRELSPEYVANRKLSGAIHAAASQIMRERYAQLLAEPVAEGRTATVLFTAGGGGSGKSTARKKVMGKRNDDITVDGTLSNYDRSHAEIEAALGSGRDVVISFVFRDPVLAWDASLTRGAKPNARTVPNWALAEAHAKAPGVIRQLAKDYADDPRVKIVAIDNDGRIDDAHEIAVESVPEVPNEQDLKAAFDRFARQALETGAIGEGHYQALVEAKPSRGAVRPSPEAGPAREDRDAITQDPAAGGVSASGDRTLLQRAVDGVRSLFQSQRPSVPRGQIAIAPDRSMRIDVLEKADASTFLHESGHFFLEVMRDIVADQQATPEAQTQGAAILEWLGVASFDAIETEHHEKFARGFEQYLGEGKAPSLELQTVFAQFKAWILGVYRTLQGLNVELTDDARAMFDRLLASDEEVEAAQIRQGMAPLAMNPTEARGLGLTDKQFADYQAMTAAATEEARAEVMQKLVAAQRREAARWWKQERAAVRAEVDAAYEATPAVRALRILNGAQTMDGAPVPEALAGMKLDRAALVAQYGDAYLKRLGRTYAKAGGVSPDMAAAMLGFSSGDALVTALANVPDTLARVDAEVDAIMRERHGDPMTDGTIAEVAMDAAHNTRRVQVMQFELDLLAKLAGQPVPTARELRALAERIVAGKTPRTLTPNNYLAAERRAARDATKAAAKGAYGEALVAKRQQALNAALYRVARDASERAEATIRYLRKAASDKTRERVGKQAGKPYVDALDALLEGHEVAPVSGREVARRASLREWVARVQADGSNTAVTEALLARVESERVTNLADLTVADLAELREAVENLLHLARVKNRLLSAKGEREWEDAKAELVAQLERQAPRHGRGAVSDADRNAFSLVADYYAAGANWLLQPETVIEWLDGGTTGPFHDLLWDIANRAEERQTALNRQVGEKLQAALDAMPAGERKRLDQRWRIESLDADVSGHSILSALLNMGNAGNRDKLLRGGRVLGDAIVPFTEEQLAEMFSKLTVAQARLVQDVWDAVNSLWPEVVALEERLNGITPEKIEAQQFTVITRDGAVPLRGGYFPAMYDPKGARAGQFSADEQAQRVLAGQTPIKASTSKGHTEARTDYVAPLLLDYHAVLTRHLDGVIGDIAYREVLRQFYRVLGDPDIRRMIDNRVGDGAAKGVQKALERGVTGNFALAGPLFGPLQGAADKGMTNISSAALGFRVPLALANIVTSPIMATARVKKRFLISGFADYYGGGINPVANMRRNAAAIHALSPMMAQRAEARTVELRSIVATLRGQRGFRAKMIELAMSVHQWIVPLAENAIWLSAYKQTQAGGSDMREAANAADKAIRQTQTKHSAKDLSMAEGGYMRPLMQFAGPLVIINNRLQESGLRGLRGDVKSRTQALGVWLAMAAGGAWVFELMMGRGADDEDDDGDTDAKDWIQWAATKLALMPFAAIPLVRDVAGYADQGFMRGTPLAEAGKSLVDFGKQAWAGGIAGIDDSFEAMGGDFVDESEFDPERAARSTLNAAGAVTGVPSNQLWRTGTYLMEVGTGDHVPENPAADAYYLLQGPPKE